MDTQFINPARAQALSCVYGATAILFNQGEPSTILS